MEQIISLAGALLILAAYGGHQLGMLDGKDPAYSWMNLIGSVILAVIAFRARQRGFVLLESVWAAISVPPLFRSRAAE